jgi:hypothetical protein
LENPSSLLNKLVYTGVVVPKNTIPVIGLTFSGEPFEMNAFDPQFQPITFDLPFTKAGSFSQSGFNDPLFIENDLCHR